MNGNTKYEGTIYRRTLISPASIGTGDYGKPYIGKSSNSKTRDQNWKKKNNKNYGGKKINDARSKYGIGIDAWITETLEVVYAETKEQLNAILKEKETAYIIRFDSVENGFNSSYGDGMKGVSFSIEHRAKIGAASRGRHHSEGTKMIISQKMKGRSHTMEARAKISAANKGIKRTDEQRKAQSERMKGKEPIQASAAAREYRKTHKPYWQEHPISDEMRANMKAAQQLRGTNVRAIFPDGSTKEFSTMLDAAKACSMNVGSVANVIKSNGICRNGMKFEKIA